LQLQRGTLLLKPESLLLTLKGILVGRWNTLNVAFNPATDTFLTTL
jgi:hypothetical protein